MNKSLLKETRSKVLSLGIMAVFILMAFVSCKEEFDGSNFAIKSEQTIADFIDADEQYSMARDLFHKVKMGAVEGASPIYSLLTARGNYTVFLPTNSAIEKFMAEEGFATFDALLNNDEAATLVAKSCIIDNGDDNAYETADFPTTSSFDKPNLNDRLLTCSMDDNSNFVINGSSHVISENNEVSNGFVHVVDVVVAPSSMTLDKLIGEADNMKVFSYLLSQTTWADSLHENLDLSYEDPDRPLKYELNNVAPFTYAQHRYIGYTALVEPDSVYENKLGVQVKLNEKGELENGNEFLEKLSVLLSNVYGTQAADNFAHPDNAVNRFVAYHLIYGKLAYNKLNFHYNEYNYQFGQWNNPQRTNMPTNVWDYYSTMGKYRGLLKITQVGDAGFERDIEHTVYANRISVYANGPEDDYREMGVVSGFSGIRIAASNGENDNNGLNGYYYPIDDLLLYTDAFRNELSKERIRMDLSTILPELASNNVKGTIYTRFENGYFDNISRESADTKLLYLMPQGAWSWNNYQGDEFMVAGLYDFTLKIPRVPKDGTYEIRMGVAQNSLRGMCQIYFGDDPDRLMPAGLPYDMRQLATPDNPSIPWIDDGEDWTVNFENDKNLRNQGYLKGPQYYTVTNGKADTPVRRRGNEWACLRRIITVVDMKSDKDYYLRFKTALKKTDSQFYCDYIEYASTSVFNGPVSEDIW